MKTLVIEAFPLLRDALLHQLESNENISAVRVEEDLEQVLQHLADWGPDLLWLDGGLPEVREKQIIKTIRRMAPQVRVLLFGPGETIPEIKNYFKQGIQAYLPKTAEPEEIAAAIACLAENNLYVPSSLNKTFMSWVSDPVRKKKPGTQLTQREREVLYLIVEEYTTNEIAQKLYISQCTVETHRINIIQKLGVKNTAGLVRVAFEAGLYSRGIV